MDKKVIFSVLCGGLLSSLFAQENEGRFYAELDGGLSLHAKTHQPDFDRDITSNPGFLAYGEFGYVYQSFRFALGLGYDQFKIERFGGDRDVFLKIKTLFSTFNVYYDYALTDAANLYVGAGFGYGRIDLKATIKEGDVITISKKHQTRYVYQLMAGISFDINENWTFKTGYRFLDTGVQRYPHSHMIEAGIRYNF